jgi:transcription initiation factor TFIIB
MERQLIKRCPQCGSSNFIQDPNGEIVCAQCNLVVQGEINKKAEWRTFAPEEKELKSRVGPPTTLLIPDKGLSTIKKISSIRSVKERNLNIAMFELSSLSDKLHAPKKVQEEAARIYRIALKKNLIHGRKIRYLVAAALLIAFRKSKIPRTLKEISEAGKFSKKTIFYYYRFLINSLSLKITPIKAVAYAYLSKIAEKIGIPLEIQVKANEILRQVEEKKDFYGKNPLGLAAAALFIACSQNEKFNKPGLKANIAKAAGISSVTLRNRSKDLKKKLKLL